MGGGLFGSPLYLNAKCLVFSALIIGVYYLPKPYELTHNIVMCFLLGMASYISLAWYDYIYDCTDLLRPTLLGWLSKSFKPPHYEDEYSKLPIKTKKAIHMFDIIVLFFVALAVIYPFLVKRYSYKIKF